MVHALGPKEASNEIINAHDSAVLLALDYLERHTAVGRRGTDGVIPIDSTGFVAAAFHHGTSRAGDPLLYTRVLVANLIHGDDGNMELGGSCRSGRDKDRDEELKPF